jgi:hypothetical protein
MHLAGVESAKKATLLMHKDVVLKTVVKLHKKVAQKLTYMETALIAFLDGA